MYNSSTTCWEVGKGYNAGDTGPSHLHCCRQLPLHMNSFTGHPLAAKCIRRVLCLQGLPCIRDNGLLHPSRTVRLDNKEWPVDELH